MLHLIHMRVTYSLLALMLFTAWGCSGIRSRSHVSSFGGNFPNSPVIAADHTAKEPNSGVTKNPEKITLDSDLDNPIISEKGQLTKKELKRAIVMLNAKPNQKFTDSSTKKQPPVVLPMEPNSNLSFIFSLVSLIFFPLCIPGLILGIVGLKRYNQNPENYNSASPVFARTGIIISSIFLVLIIAYFILIAILFAI
jgi:hypothetical protein